jgi:D-glycero-D-manno-heptose 1,7-bisphosphate phosphatase
VKPAVFLDRDGTLIELVHHLSKPHEVKLYPRAGEAVRELRRLGFACVIVTNQSAIARGLLTVEGLHEVHAELLRQLSEWQAELDGFYFCAEMPINKDPRIIDHPDRKPGPGMILRAAGELGLDLASSWMVGDTVSDMCAGRNAGCGSTVLVRTGYGSGVTLPDPAIDHEVSDLWAAVALIAGRKAKTA